jgi:helicase
MRVAGVFVGLSAQTDSRFPALGFGERDARRLAALFADGNAELGADPGLIHLLRNEKATGAAVRDALMAATAAVAEGAAELVVVHFACHGTPFGQLVLYDSDRDDIDGTTLALHEVADLLGRVPAGKAILTLDSCFSGTVLGMPGSLNAEAFGRLMSELHGEGRFVAWAAGPDEKAFESAQVGHGYLTYGLVSALEGARVSGHTTLSVVVWIQRALEEATELARRAGRTQTPSCHLRSTAAARLRVPEVGPQQRAFAYAGGIHAVTPALDSLEVYGFTTDEIAACKARLGDGATMNSLQLEAIAPGGVLAGDSVLVRAPTTAGKTFVGELAILQQVRSGRRALVLVPMRALVHEQAGAFQRAYAALGLRVILSTGEVVDDDDLLRGSHFDVAFMTYEKCAAILNTRPDLLERVGVVVFDELQTIEDDHRGRVVELLVCRMRRLMLDTKMPQLVVLCGELGDLNRFEAWLGARPVGPGQRPVPLHEGVVTPSGSARLRLASGETKEATFPRVSAQPPAHWRLRYPEERRGAKAVALAQELVERGQQVLLFASTRPQAMRLARWLAETPGLRPAAEVVRVLEELPAEELHRASSTLLDVARKGVAFHTADLDVRERQAVEGAFRAGRLRVLAATTTLAMGINTPADAVIVVDNTLWNPERGDEPIKLISYRNMAGRAGRSVPGGPAEGAAYLIADTDVQLEELWLRYVAPTPVLLQSSLGELPTEDLLVSLLDLRGEAGFAQLLRDAGDTYWGFLARQADGWETAQRRAFDASLQALRRDGFVEDGASPNVRLTPLGRVCATFNLHVRSVRRLRQALTAIISAGETIDDACLVALAQLTTELDDLPMPTLRPPFQTSWPEARRGPLTGRLATYNALIDRSDLEEGEADKRLAARLHRFVGLFYWLRGESPRRVEEIYSTGADQPALRRLRDAADRTADMVPAIAAVIMALFPDRASAVRGIVNSLRARLEIGGSEAASRLHRLRLGFTRPQCLSLVKAGIAGEVELRDALQHRRNELEALFTTVGIADLERVLSLAPSARRRVSDESQEVLDFFGAAVSM